MSKVGKRILTGLEVVKLDPALLDFQAESNKIEGILLVKQTEVEALEDFIKLDKITIQDLKNYVEIIQPNALLRNTVDIPGVRVGKHIAPSSGPELMIDLQILLDQVNNETVSEYKAHCTYETLHPFTDGNGRSGRALWLWMHNGKAPLGFLHQFYYESLSAYKS
jgi:hypothetical protein